MNLHAIYHRPKQNFAYAYDTNTIHLRLRVAKGDAKKVTVIYGDPYHWVSGGGGGNLNAEGAHGWVSHYLEMKKECSTDLFDFYQLPVSPEFKRMRYAFIVEGKKQSVLYGEKQLISLNHCADLLAHPDNQPHFENLGNFFCFPFLNGIDVFDAPEWVKETVWYQIFPERFENGDTSNDPENVVAWGSIDPKYDTFYGGDIAGILSRLDYLSNLGINGIYLCPIFKAPSTHKYDTTDYLDIDPAFGDKKLFKTFVDEAHARGIRIMLDAVFNHSGWLLPQWQDVIEKGEASAYKDWFHIRKFPLFEENADPILHPGGLNYDAFAFAKYMPKLNTENKVLRDYLLEVGRYWVREFNIDAWRLDVANEVDHSFWRDFRTAVREERDDVYILGEVWHDAQPWLNGDQFDAVMNYPLTDAMLQFIAKGELKPSEFEIAVNKIFTNYAHNVNEVAFNLLDSHDTARLLTICQNNKQKALLAYTLQMTQTGTPCIYYGGEIGLDGGADPLCRKCMIWDEEKQDLYMFDYLQKLIKLRRTTPTMRSHDIQFHLANDKQNILIFEKRAQNESLIVVMNNDHHAQTITAPSHLAGCYYDLLTDKTIDLNNKLTIEPLSAFLLVPLQN